MKFLSFEKDLKEQLLFKKFPMDIKIEDFYFYSEYKRDYINGYLIMVFDFTVCGKCLYEELAVLKHFREKIDEKNIFIIAIIGLINKNEESDVINLHKCGGIFFPCKSISVDYLYDKFHLNKENFIDTPFYIYTSHQFQILDIFKPQKFDTKEFHKWLTILTSQDIL